MRKVLAVARSDLCLGFSLTGLDCVPCVGREDAVAAISDAMEGEEVGIVIVEEELLAGADPRLLKEYGRSARPLIVPVPGTLLWKDAEEEAKDDLIAKLVRQAVGYGIQIKS